MSRSRTLLAAGAALLALASCAESPRTILEAATLEEATTLAAESGGLIVAYFWRDG
jgi:hypothetical protein